MCVYSFVTVYQYYYNGYRYIYLHIRICLIMCFWAKIPLEEKLASLTVLYPWSIYLLSGGQILELSVDNRQDTNS